MDCHQELTSIAKLAAPIIAAVAGLVGVIVGGIITVWSQNKARRQTLIREKLDKLYSPLLATRMEILAKSQVRVKIEQTANAEWRALFEGVENPLEKKRITDERADAFGALTGYSAEQFKTELVPLYKQMVTIFTTNMQFAEESTRLHFGVLVEFTELWNRQLQTPMPPEVVLSLKHSEKSLYPLYEDLETQFRKLREQLE